MSAIATVVFAVILFRTAWISDDAAITLRTVLNVTHGFGLTFNIAERVQTYTHPLWMGLLTIGYLVIRNVYITTFAIALILSILAFWVALTRALSSFQAISASIVLLFSAAFVDFSTSGLENPLLNVLMAAFAGLFLNTTMSRLRRLTLLCMVASLLYLTRPDAVLVAAPLLAVANWRAGNARMVLKSIVLGSLPAIGWTIFALIYYGFPFPNTGYAKLATGIDPGELRAQGVLYLLDSLDRDPITLTAIAIATVVAAFQRSVAPRALAAGVILYLGYIISIGGDFMAGRFLALPVFASVLLMTRFVGSSKPLWGTTAGVLLIVGCTATHVPLWSNSRNVDASPKPSGIVDERAVYFRERSLALARRGTFRDPDWPSSPCSKVCPSPPPTASSLSWGPTRRRISRSSQSASRISSSGKRGKRRSKSSESTPLRR